MRTVDGFVVSLLCLAAGALHAQVNVTTYHNDNARTGQNTQETILTAANVNSTQFGKLYSVAVDGAVYAQPLYLSNLAIAGETHNVVYVATEHDSVFAIDADTGVIYSHVSLIAPGGSTPNSLTNLGCSDLVPEVGITGTPVIDIASGTLYVVAKSLVGGNVVQYLHALDVASLAEKFGGPVVIQGSVVGTASDGNGSTLSFNPTRQHQRAALLLENGHVAIGWGSHCDNPPFHGWVMSYSASTLAQEAVFSTSPNGVEGGVWMSGGGPAADANGYIYVATGNGTWDGSANFGDSILKLGPPANTSFAIIDYFTPHNQNSLFTGDIDVAAGGLLLLPPLPSGHQLLAQQSKEGTIYLLDTGNLGKYCINQVPACTTNDPQIVQEIQSASPGVWGSPTYWNGNVYWTGANDAIKAYSFNAGNSGRLSTTPTSQSRQIFPFSSPTPTVSSNGTQNGILWALDGSADNSTCGSPGQDCLGLYAYDATNLANLLYISSQAANNRDSPGSAVKFEKPIVANGKVYVGTASSLSVYGLLSTQLTAATPTISPGTGTYGSAQTVAISDATAGATIRYTTDGTLPNASSTPYSGPITVSAAERVEAIALVTGYRNSAVASAVYTFGGTPVINDPTGFASAAGLSLRGGATLSNGTLQLSDGGQLEARAVWYATPVNVQNFTTDFDFLLTAAVADGFTFTLQNSAAGTTALGPAGSGLGYQGITSSVAVKFDLHNNAGEGIDSTGFYVNGAIPTVPAVDMSASGVNLHSGDVMHAHLAYDGATLTLTLTDTVTAASFTTAAAINIPGTVGAATAYAGFTAGTGGSSATQSIMNWTYGTVSTAATPTFSPGTGTYGSAQTVTISDATAGATIHYTTDGTTPGASSTLYSGPITVSAAETVKALAVATGYRNSVVASAAYTFGGTPVINDPTGFASAAGLSLRGGATLSNGTLQLSDGGQLEARAVWYATPVNVQNFTTDFDFLLTAAVADGFTFTLQNSAAGTTALGPAGSGLGYQGITSSVAVKFDLHNNAGEGIDSTGFYVNGAIPTVPAVDMSASGVNLHSGDVMHAHLVYDGATLTLTLTDTVTAASFTTAAAINIPGTVGAATAYAGFTAGTGGSSATQSIMNWTYGTVSTAATPTFSPGTGTYGSAQTVTISDATAGATIHYTTDGTTPGASSTLYSGPITVSAAETVKALAVATGYRNSVVASAAYTFGGTPVINDPTGFASAAGLSLRGGATLSNGTLQLSDGGQLEARAVWYATPVNVQNFTTDFDFLLTAAVADGFTFTLQNSAAGTTALGPAGSGLGYQGIASSVAVKFDLHNNAGEGIDSTGFYVNGAIPTVPAVDMSASGVNLHSGDVMHAHLAYDGATLTLTLTDTVTAASFTTAAAINIPGTVGAATAYAGFTAGTGGSSATQSIMNWMYTH